MKNSRTQSLSCICLFLVVCWLFVGCTNAAPGPGRPEKPVMMPVFCEAEQLVWQDESHTARLDASSLEKGYVAACCVSQVPAKMRVSKDGSNYAYQLDNTGQHQFYPLAMGSGTYTFEIFLHAEGNSWQLMEQVSRKVELENEQAPFLLPTALVNYGQEDAIVELGQKLANGAGSDAEVVSRVYSWAKQNLTYDFEKAEVMKTARGYVPDIDSVLAQGKGICFDIAVTTAALLRVNGIPCKLVIGRVDVGEGEWIAHAWNMVWLEEDGRIAKGLDAGAFEWTRLDMTMLCNGEKGRHLASNDACYRTESEH